ncbi:MAG: DUF3368 domain-containing protein [Candidatus Aenigmarchaeota archaeon]|nr:DUF3368 domain-containing protein [Candidatus Aenigmarchaeota archaeon]
MSYVFDSSSLIYLGKLRILDKVAKLEGRKFIPDSVYKEVVVKGFERKEPEAKYIDELIKKKLFAVRKPKTAARDIPFLSKADREVLALSKETESTAIIDELHASSIAEAQGIESHGSIYMLLRLLEKKIISKKETVNYLDRMVGFGFYLSADMYREVLNAIEKMK